MRELKLDRFIVYIKSHLKYVDLEAQQYEMMSLRRHYFVFSIP